MARISKDCPRCGGRRPVALRFVPGATDPRATPDPRVPATTGAYQATCRACGFVHPADGPVLQTSADVQTWLQAHRAAARTAKVAARVPLGPSGL